MKLYKHILMLLLTAMVSFQSCYADIFNSHYVTTGGNGTYVVLNSDANKNAAVTAEVAGVTRVDDKTYRVVVAVKKKSDSFSKVRLGDDELTVTINDKELNILEVTSAGYGYSKETRELLADSCTFTISGTLDEDVTEENILNCTVNLSYVCNNGDSKSVSAQVVKSMMAFAVTLEAIDEANGVYRLAVTNLSDTGQKIYGLASIGCFQVMGKDDADIAKGATVYFDLKTQQDLFSNNKCFDNITFKCIQDGLEKSVVIPVSLLYMPSWVAEHPIITATTMIVTGLVVVVVGSVILMHYCGPAYPRPPMALPGPLVVPPAAVPAIAIPPGANAAAVAAALRAFGAGYNHGCWYVGGQLVKLGAGAAAAVAATLRAFGANYDHGRWYVGGQLVK